MSCSMAFGISPVVKPPLLRVFSKNWNLSQGFNMVKNWAYEGSFSGLSDHIVIYVFRHAEFDGILLFLYIYSLVG